MMTFTIIVAVLLMVNLLLLRYSCNKSVKVAKKEKNKISSNNNAQELDNKPNIIEINMPLENMRKSS